MARAFVLFGRGWGTVVFVGLFAPVLSVMYGLLFAGSCSFCVLVLGLCLFWLGFLLFAFCSAVVFRLYSRFSVCCCRFGFVFCYLDAVVGSIILAVVWWGLSLFFCLLVVSSWNVLYYSCECGVGYLLVSWFSWFLIAPLARFHTPSNHPARCIPVVGFGFLCGWMLYSPLGSF